MAENNSNTQVYIATQTAHVDYGPDRVVIKKNLTRLAADHPLVAKYPGFFKPAEDGLRFSVENAQDTPGGGTRNGSTAVGRYADYSKAQLSDEVDNRNKSRDADHQIVVQGRKSVASLTAALEADDDLTAAAAAEAQAAAATVPSDSDDATQTDDASDETTGGLTTADMPGAGGTDETRGDSA